MGVGERLDRTWALLKILTPREFRVRYRESVLDLAWAVITPLVYLVVYGVILTQAFGAEGGCAPYLSSAWTGLVVWTFFSGALSMATSVPVLGDPANSLKVTAEMLASAATPRTKGVMLNSPSNPTGCVYSKAELEALADVMLTTDAAILSDEIYEHLLYDGATVKSVASFSQARHASLMA